MSRNLHQQFDTIDSSEGIPMFYLEYVNHEPISIQGLVNGWPCQVHPTLWMQCSKMQMPRPYQFRLQEAHCYFIDCNSVHSPFSFASRSIRLQRICAAECTRYNSKMEVIWWSSGSFSNWYLLHTTQWHPLEWQQNPHGLWSLSVVVHRCKHHDLKTILLIPMGSKLAVLCGKSPNLSKCVTN